MRPLVCLVRRRRLHVPITQAHHMAGVEWNPRGGDALAFAPSSAAAPAAAAAAPAPVAAKRAPAPAAGGGGGLGDLKAVRIE